MTIPNSTRTASKPPLPSSNPNASHSPSNHKLQTTQLSRSGNHRLNHHWTKMSQISGNRSTQPSSHPETATFPTSWKCLSSESRIQEPEARRILRGWQRSRRVRRRRELKRCSIRRWRVWGVIVAWRVQIRSWLRSGKYIGRLEGRAESSR